MRVDLGRGRLGPVRRGLALALVGVVLAAGVVVVEVFRTAAPAAAQDVAGAGAEAARLQAELDAAAERYETVWAAVELATFELEELERQAAELSTQAADLDLRLAERAREVFKHGARTSLELLLGEGGPADAIERAGLAAVIQQPHKVNAFLQVLDVQ